MNTAFSPSQAVFDQEGRRHPLNVENQLVFFESLAINWQELIRCFNGTGLRPEISISEFREKYFNLADGLSCDGSVANILNGPHFPVVIPKSRFLTYGSLAKKLVRIAGLAITSFSSRPYINQLAGSMGMTVSCLSRHQRLVEKIKTRPVVGIYFPCALQGCSISQMRQDITELPDGFMLPGVVDSSIALIMHSELSRLRNAILLCPGVHWGGDCSDEECPLAFKFEYEEVELTCATTSIYHRDSRNLGGLLYIGAD